MELDLSVLEKRLEEALAKETPESMKEFFDNCEAGKEYSHNPEESYNIIKDRLHSVLNVLKGLGDNVTTTTDNLKNMVNNMSAPSLDHEQTHTVNNKEQHDDLYKSLNNMLRQAREGMQGLSIDE